MPSIRGIEKPHTSASTAATRWPRCASAMERFVVTDDLPTPPLPDTIASTRVRVSVNGFTRGSGARGAAAASRTWSGFGVTPFRMSATARSSASSMSRRSTSTRSTPGTAATASTTRRLQLGAGVVAGEGQRQGDGDPLALAGYVADHAEVGDRAPELGFLDPGQGRPDVCFDRRHPRAPGEEDFHYGDR